MRHAALHPPTPALRTAQNLSLLIAPLTALAAGWGFFAPGVYRDAAALVSQTRGQDLVTLLAAAVFALLLPAARRGSARATLVWLGLLGYIAYTYVGAAFAYAFNSLFLLYVALFSLSLFALAFALRGLDAGHLAKGFDDRVPRRSVIAYLGLVAGMLSVLWLGRTVPAIMTPPPPTTPDQSLDTFKYVFALDLGLVVPLAVAAAVGLWRRRAWGYVVAGVILIKALTMGLALLSMTVFALRADPTADLSLIAPWVALAGSSLWLSVWYFRHCRT